MAVADQSQGFPAWNDDGYGNPITTHSLSVMHGMVGSTETIKQQLHERFSRYGQVYSISKRGERGYVWFADIEQRNRAAVSENGKELTRNGGTMTIGYYCSELTNRVPGVNDIRQLKLDNPNININELMKCDNFWNKNEFNDELIENALRFGVETRNGPRSLFYYNSGLYKYPIWIDLASSDRSKLYIIHVRRQTEHEIIRMARQIVRNLDEMNYQESFDMLKDLLDHNDELNVDWFQRIWWKDSIIEEIVEFDIAPHFHIFQLFMDKLVWQKNRNDDKNNETNNGGKNENQNENDHSNQNGSENNDSAATAGSDENKEKSEKSKKLQKIRNDSQNDKDCDGGITKDEMVRIKQCLKDRYLFIAVERFDFDLLKLLLTKYALNPCVRSNDRYSESLIDKLKWRFDDYEKLSKESEEKNDQDYSNFKIKSSAFSIKEGENDDDNGNESDSSNNEYGDYQSVYIKSLFLQQYLYATVRSNEMGRYLTFLYKIFDEHKSYAKYNLIFHNGFYTIEGSSDIRHKVTQSKGLDGNVMLSVSSDRKYAHFDVERMCEGGGNENENENENEASNNTQNIHWSQKWYFQEQTAGDQKGYIICAISDDDNKQYQLFTDEGHKLKLKEITNEDINNMDDEKEGRNVNDLLNSLFAITKYCKIDVNIQNGHYKGRMEHMQRKHASFSTKLIGDANQCRLQYEKMKEMLENEISKAKIHGNYRVPEGYNEIDNINNGHNQQNGRNDRMVAMDDEGYGDTTNVTYESTNKNENDKSENNEQGSYRFSRPAPYAFNKNQSNVSNNNNNDYYGNNDYHRNKHQNRFYNSRGNNSHYHTGRGGRGSGGRGGRGGYDKARQSKFGGSRYNSQYNSNENGNRWHGYGISGYNNDNNNNNNNNTNNYYSNDRPSNDRFGYTYGGNGNRNDNFGGYSGNDNNRNNYHNYNNNNNNNNNDSSGRGGGRFRRRGNYNGNNSGQHSSQQRRNYDETN